MPNSALQKNSDEDKRSARGAGGLRRQWRIEEAVGQMRRRGLLAELEAVAQLLERIAQGVPEGVSLSAELGNLTSGWGSVKELAHAVDGERDVHESQQGLDHGDGRDSVGLDKAHGEDSTPAVRAEEIRRLIGEIVARDDEEAGSQPALPAEVS